MFKMVNLLSGAGIIWIYSSFRKKIPLVFKEIAHLAGTILYAALGRSSFYLLLTCVLSNKDIALYFSSPYFLFKCFILGL